jgi:hypothetical protein
MFEDDSEGHGKTLALSETLMQQTTSESSAASWLLQGCATKAHGQMLHK